MVMMEIDVFDSRLCPEKKLMSVDTECFPAINMGNLDPEFKKQLLYFRHTRFRRNVESIEAGEINLLYDMRNHLYLKKVVVILVPLR